MSNADIINGSPDRTRHNTCTTSPSLNPNAPPFAPTPGKNHPYAQPYSHKARPSQPPFRNTTQNTQVQILYFNARSLTNKRQELLDTLRSLSLTPQIIAITETWLTDNIPDGMISLPNYKQIFRADRPKQEGRRGGGVLILARDDVVCSRRHDLQTWSESVWIEARVQFSTPLIVGCIYRPPSTATADINKFTACLEDAFDKIDKCNHNINRPNIALVGDFNATSPKWCASDKYNCAGRLIEESVLRLGLHQLVDFPTHLL